MGENELAPKLSKEQYDLLLYLEQTYWRTSSLPSYDLMQQQGIELPRSTYDEAWANPRFVDALRARGLPEYLLTTSSGTFGGRILTEQQMQVANVLLDTTDSRSRLKKLTELGVSSNTYNQWLKDPVYRNYCLERAEDLILAAQPTAHMSLIRQVEAGDLGAVKYFNALTGRFRERAPAAASVEINNNTVNLGNDLLIQVVEVIQRHVKDPVMLEAIGKEILELTQGLGGLGGAGLAVGGRRELPPAMTEIKEFKNARTISGMVG